MQKLKNLIYYQCSTKLPMIGLFYLIEFATTFVIATLMMANHNITQFSVGNFLELGSMAFIGILGISSSKEDFKSLMQNGFTRQYIFLGAMGMFLFIASSMAFIDTLVGQLLHRSPLLYDSIFGFFYGYAHVGLNWLWLTSLYLMIQSLLYLLVTTVMKIGKRAAICLGLLIGGGFLFIIALFSYVLPVERLLDTLKFLGKLLGYTNSPHVHYGNPILTFLSLFIIFSLGTYWIIRKTELKF